MRDRKIDWERDRNTEGGREQYDTSAMLSIFGRAGAILLAVVEVSHALYA